MRSLSQLSLKSDVSWNWKLHEEEVTFSHTEYKNQQRWYKWDERRRWECNYQLQRNARVNDWVRDSYWWFLVLSNTSEENYSRFAKTSQEI